MTQSGHNFERQVALTLMLVEASPIGDRGAFSAIATTRRKVPTELLRARSGSAESPLFQLSRTCQLAGFSCPLLTQSGHPLSFFRSRFANQMQTGRLQILVLPLKEAYLSHNTSFTPFARRRGRCSRINRRWSRMF